MRNLTLRMPVLGMLLMALTSWSAFAAVSVKGTSFSVEQLKMGDLIAFDDASALQQLADLSPDEFLALSAKDVQKMTGQKMAFSDRMSFNVVQRQVKKQLKKAKKVSSLDQVDKTDAFNFSWLWFILGIIGGVITLIVSLFFGSDAILSTLLGMVIWAAVVLIFSL